MVPPNKTKFDINIGIVTTFKHDDPNYIINKILDLLKQNKFNIKYNKNESSYEIVTNLAEVEFNIFPRKREDGSIEIDWNHLYGDRITFYNFLNNFIEYIHNNIVPMEYINRE